MEIIAKFAAAPTQKVWDWISEQADAIAAESSLFAKGWHLFFMLFLLTVLVGTIVWFIVFKAVQMAFVVTFGVVSFALIFSGQ